MSCLNTVWNLIFKNIIIETGGIFAIQEADTVKVISKFSCADKLICLFDSKLLLDSMKKGSVPGQLLNGKVTVKKGGCIAFQDILANCLKEKNIVREETSHLSQMIVNSIKVKRYWETQGTTKNDINLNVLEEIDCFGEFKRISVISFNLLKKHFDEIVYNDKVSCYKGFYTKDGIDENTVWEYLGRIIFSVLMSTDFTDANRDKDKIQESIKKLNVTINGIPSFAQIFFEISENLTDTRKDCLDFYKDIFPEKYRNLRKEVWGDDKKLYLFLNEPLDGQSDEQEKMKIYFSYKMDELELFINNCKRYVIKNGNMKLNSFINREIQNKSLGLDILSEYENLIGANREKNTFPWLMISHIVGGNRDFLMMSFYEKNKKVIPSVEWLVFPFYVDKQALEILVPNENNVNERVNWLNKYIDTHMNVKELGECQIQFEKNEVVAVKGDFRLEDLYCNGKHLKDFERDMFSFLDMSPEDITFMFQSVDSSQKISMYLGGDKICIARRHLLQTIFMSDKIFSFKLMGQVKKMAENKYSLKPYVILYLNLFVK